MYPHRILFVALACAAPSTVRAQTAPTSESLDAQPSSPHLRVDAFGYRPTDAKRALLREPVVGYDAPRQLTPPPNLRVHRARDASVAFSGPVVPWNGGAVDVSSGDRVWSFEFGALTEVGRFYVQDPHSGAASETFRIGAAVYAPVARHALRMFTHQRCGSAKSTPSIPLAWNDGACHRGPQQDTDCRFVLDTSPSTALDLSGGWHDAGDYNKYVNFADDALHALLGAYTSAPAAWTDTFGLPESGNGVPDLLDEVRHELEWLLRMQRGDGSVLHKVSVTDFSAASPPSADHGARRYAPATASATISACGVFAHAARVFGVLPDPSSQAFAAQLRTASNDAWDWLASHPAAIPSAYDNAGFASADAEDSAYEQSVNRLRAAVHLFALTGDVQYRTFVDAGTPGTHLFQWTWASPWEWTAQDALLEYAALPGATASVAASIRSLYTSLVSGPQHLGHALAQDDPYGAYLEPSSYVWGSNRTKSRQGGMFASMLRYGLDPAQAGAYRAAAAGYLHGLHGVNPLGLCYLTNMDGAGAAHSARETYHAWFADGTLWDRADEPIGPPPGYLTGGPNPTFAPDPAYGGPPLAPPQGQPYQKSYRDWNAGWPENSWEVSECHIPYQAAYLELLAAFL